MLNLYTLYRWIQNIKIFELTIEIFRDFHQETSEAPSQAPTFLVEKIGM